MLALQVALCVLLCSGVIGRHRSAGDCVHNLSLEGRMLLAVFDNEVDDDGFVTGVDFGHDGVRYQYDENLCDYEKWEFLSRWTCRYGWSQNYGEFMFARFDGNGDGRLTDADFGTGAGTSNPIPKAAFTKQQYTRFQNYCALPGNKALDSDCVTLENSPVPDFMNN